MTQSSGIFWMLAVILRVTALFNKIFFLNLSREQQIIIIFLCYLHSFNAYRSNQEAFSTLFKNKHRSNTYEIQPRGTQLKFNGNTKTRIPYQENVAEQVCLWNQDFLICACFKNQNCSIRTLFVFLLWYRFSKVFQSLKG